MGVSASKRERVSASVGGCRKPLIVSEAVETDMARPREKVPRERARVRRVRRRRERRGGGGGVWEDSRGGVGGGRVESGVRVVEVVEGAEVPASRREDEWKSV